MSWASGTVSSFVLFAGQPVLLVPRVGQSTCRPPHGSSRRERIRFSRSLTPNEAFECHPSWQQNDEIGVRHQSDPIDSVRRTVHRTARWSALVVATAAFLTTACRDDSKVDVAATDSSLARDITLASAVTAPTPQLRDSPDSAPPTAEAPLPKPKLERKPPRPATQPSAPVRETPAPASGVGARR